MDPIDRVRELIAGLPAVPDEPIVADFVQTLLAQHERIEMLAERLEELGEPSDQGEAQLRETCAAFLPQLEALHELLRRSEGA